MPQIASLASIVLLGSCVLVFLGCSAPDDNPQAGDADDQQPKPGLPWFVDVTQTAGIDFAHFDPATDKHFMQETMGSGIGWIDYDNDGWLDLFCVQDCPVSLTDDAPRPTNKLYRNNGDGSFTDVTEDVLPKKCRFHMGCAVGDYDNDGWDDLAVTYLGGVALYRNEQGKRFRDVSDEVRLTNNPHFATSCAWGDIDGDGYLDLYVCNYVEIDPQNPILCTSRKGGKVFPFQCAPSAHPMATHKLYRFDPRQHVFDDISEPSGVAQRDGTPGLGVLMADFNDDGKTDIFVANDLRPAFLFLNQGNRKFKEVAFGWGCALQHDGSSIAGMGVAAGDLTGDGRLSLFVTNYQNCANVLFVHRFVEGRHEFIDMSYASGLGLPSLPRLGFGTEFLDPDLDGDLDVVVVNGHVQRFARELFGFGFGQTDQLFLCTGRLKYREFSNEAGPYFRREHVGRGLAVADWNNDGRPDMAISNNGGPTVLLRNDSQLRNRHWIMLQLEGDPKAGSNRNAIGAKVTIEADELKLHRFVVGGGSYLSASARRISVGLGSCTKVDSIKVRWPSGRQQVFTDLPVDRRFKLIEGRAAPRRLP